MCVFLFGCLFFLYSLTVLSFDSAVPRIESNHYYLAGGGHLKAKISPQVYYKVNLLFFGVLIERHKNIDGWFIALLVDILTIIFIGFLFLVREHKTKFFEK
jgi:hypothetical protein